MRKILLILSCLVVFSCSKEYKTIDGTSKDTFEESINSISSKLTILQQDKIQEAIKLIYKYKTKGTDEKQRWEDVYKLLNGKNAEQTFDLAEEIAKANKIAWSSTSMNTVNDSVFLVDNNNTAPITQVDEKFKQIDAATKIVLRYAPISSNPATNSGFYLFPELTDDAGITVPFQNLPLTASISFSSGGTAIYMVKRTFSSSDVGNVSLKKGLTIPYNLFDKGKLTSSKLDVDMNISVGDKYLYGKLNDVPIDLSKAKDTSAEQQSAQAGLDNVKTFIQEVGNKNYARAYKLTKNPKWDSEEKFASTSTGFGTIKATNLLSSKVINSSSDKMTIEVNYQIKDKNERVKTLKQNFILNQINNNWLITDTEAKEAKDDTWKN